MSNKNDDHANVEEHILQLYEISEFKGKGAYGIVWKAVDKATKQQVALKKVFDAFQNATDAQRTFREVVFLQQLTDHENIVKLLKVLPSENQKDLYMIFEYMETDLHKVIRAGLLNPLHMQYIIYQLLKCLKYIHSGELIHRDLKPSNLLIDSDCKVKVADFGLARSVAASENQDEIPIMTEYVATRWYRAPEILLGSHNYSKSVDMWSVGCILGEMILGKAIFSGTSTLNQIEKIIELIGRPKQEELDIINASLAQQVLDSISMQKKKSFASFFPNSSSDFIDFIRQCLLWNPLKRMTIDEALRHPLMKDFISTEEEKTLRTTVRIPFNDNKKLSIKEYRDKITNQQPILTEKPANQPIAQKVEVNLLKSYYQSQPQPSTNSSTLQNYLSVYDQKLKPQQKPQIQQPTPNQIEKKYDVRKTEPTQKTDNLSVEKQHIHTYSSSKQDMSPLQKKIQPSNIPQSTTYSQLLQQKYLQSQKKTSTQSNLHKANESKSPEIKKKIEPTIPVPVTKSYSFHTESKEKSQFSSVPIKYYEKPPTVNHQRSTTTTQAPQTVAQTSSSFYQFKEQSYLKDHTQVQTQAIRSKSFEKSPIYVGPTSPFHRQKTQVDKPKFVPQNGGAATNNITQVQKLLQKCSQITNNFQHKKATTSFVEPQRPTTYQTVNYNYYDIRNSKFM